MKKAGSTTGLRCSGLRYFGIAIAALLFAAGTARAQASAGDPPPLATHAGASYAIYSLLLRDSPPTPRYPLAIAANTLRDDEIPTQPRPELLPSDSDADTFREVMADYRARGAERAQLQHALELNRPYMMLTGDEVARFRANPGTVAGLPATVRIAAFSEVYFDPGQNAALVYMTHICAAPCGSGEWVYLVRQDGQWIRASRNTPDAADIYAVYSLVMPGAPFAGLSTSQAPHFAIAAETVSIDQMNPAIAPDAQLQPPANNARAFKEAVQDFYSRRHQRTRLEPRLQLDRRYTLLSPEQVSDLRTSLTGIAPGCQLKDAWAGYPGITFFSEVYFNAAHTAALVYRNNWCASLCSNGQWIYLEKRDGHWVRRSGLNI